MAVPNKEVFEIYLSAELIIPDELMQSICSLTTPKNSEIEYFCDLLDQSATSHKNFIESSAVSKWFLSQENYKRALKYLTLKSSSNLRPTKEDIQEYKAYRVDKIKRKFDAAEWATINSEVNLETDPARHKLIIRSNKSSIDFNSKQAWEFFIKFYQPSKTDLINHGIAKCFYNYFYTDRAEKIFLLNKKGNKLLEDLRKNLSELSQFSEFNYFTTSSDFFSIPLFGNTFNRFKNTVDNVEFKSSFKRNDSTYKERVLIYDLNLLFDRYFKTSKSNAIYHLLMIEGVANTLEKRNIEKRLSEWNRH